MLLVIERKMELERDFHTAPSTIAPWSLVATSIQTRNDGISTWLKSEVIKNPKPWWENRQCKEMKFWPLLDVIIWEQQCHPMLNEGITFTGNFYGYRQHSNYWGKADFPVSTGKLGILGRRPMGSWEKERLFLLFTLAVWENPSQIPLWTPHTIHLSWFIPRQAAPCLTPTVSSLRENRSSLLPVCTAPSSMALDLWLKFLDTMIIQIINITPQWNILFPCTVSPCC